MPLKNKCIMPIRIDLELIVFQSCKIFFFKVILVSTTYFSITFSLPIGYNMKKVIDVFFYLVDILTLIISNQTDHILLNLLENISMRIVKIFIHFL